MSIWGATLLLDIGHLLFIMKKCICSFDCLVQRRPPFEKGAAFTLTAGYTMCRQMLAQDAASRGLDATCRKWCKFNFKLSANPLNNESPTTCGNKSSDAGPCCERYFMMLFTQISLSVASGVLPEVIWSCISYCNQSRPGKKSSPFPYWEWKVCSLTLCSKEFYFSKVWDQAASPWRGWEKSWASLPPDSLSYKLIGSGTPTDFKRTFLSHPCQ